MNARAKLLKQLVRDEQYVIDEVAIADAIIVRSVARRVLPDVSFGSAPTRRPQLRSFRPHRGAKSFRLCRAQRRPPHHRVGARGAER